MERLTRFVVLHRWWVLLAWMVTALAGGFAAPRATAALTYDFSLPGQRGYETNRVIKETFGSGGDAAPVLLIDAHPAPERARRVAAAVEQALPGARVLSYADQASLLSADGHTGVVVVYPRITPGPEPYAAALPILTEVAAQQQVTVTGKDALVAQSGGDQGADVLVETIFGGAGALIVLLVVFGSALALMPLLIAAGSILTTFLIVWGLTGLTDISFIVQFLLALIGLGVAIDYALLIVTRWRAELGHGASPEQAVNRALATAGRSVFFSGVTVAVSLAALIALPVPFLRSVGFTGLLIPAISVLAALTLLPALLLVAGRRLDWPHRRGTDPESRLWRRIGTAVVRHRWISVTAAVTVLVALATPVSTIRLGQPTNASLASTGGDAGTAVTRLDTAGLGAGLTTPVEILTRDPAVAGEAVTGLPGVAAAMTWPAGPTGESLVDVWTSADTSTEKGAAAAARVRAAAEATGARVGGLPAGDADFVDAVYGNAGWVITLIVVVTTLLLMRALRSIVLPIKALILNAISLGAAYGITVWIWQDGHGTELLFDQRAAAAITTWVPIAVFAFLFGLSMDYEVFLLSRIREEHDNGHATDEATVHGVARTGRLVTSAALILFLAFISLAQVPTTEVKILATALALGIIIDATIVRGVLAPALVAALGRANWWAPHRRRAPQRTPTRTADPKPGGR
ncbi:membrane protein [Actinoplanes philippinensis]|uniref:Putative drug exporter of the RND superfamily n=1 Tax=Actinoplanes philippinensis TaxID=35752 RepID=A0A1I2MLQ3_9ACTN|nr:MMPL family transporter [Actinoplanes philippinensis]GIE83155.1 membrane protein [Actinoplanes philippinensis]SFF90296.1 putative drug exporter of the RND superfamily [Actinoplanes philippinensis]